MDLLHASPSILDFTSTTPSPDGRVQIYRESRDRDFVPGFSTDSDAEIIETFLLQVPTYDGGDIRVLDQSEQRMVAFVQGKIVRTEIDLPVLQRANMFHDWHFAILTCDLLKQKKSTTRSKRVSQFGVKSQ